MTNFKNNHINSDVNNSQIDNNVKTTSSEATKQALVVLGNPENCLVPTEAKKCLPFIAVCDGILKTAENMLKQLKTQDEDYNAIMKLSWQYAILRLKAQYNLGKYFSTIEGAQGSTKKKSKEQILKEEYNISVKKAWQHERLARDEILLDETIAKAKVDGDLPTLALAMTILEEKNKKASEDEKDKNQEKHNKNQEKLKEHAKKDAEEFQKLHRTEATILEDNTFNVIYADTLSVDIKIKSLKNISIPSNENSVLLLSCNSDNLLDALDIIKSWDFEYREMCIWNRMVPSQKGLFVRNQHSILLFATKGNGLETKNKHKESSILNMHLDEKNEVSGYYYNMLETLFSDGAYLDVCNKKAYNLKWKTLSEISNQKSNSEKENNHV